MGFKDRRIGPDICRLASEYISKYEGFEDDIYAYFENEPDADSLYVKLVEEFERCILSYFGFHWNHCDILISQVSGCLVINKIPEVLAVAILSKTEHPICRVKMRFFWLCRC